MRVENESQWNTDDLRAMVAKVMEHERIDPALCGHDALLIFKTARRRLYKGIVHKAANIGYYRGVQTNRGEIKVIEIYSKDKLIEKNLLDRMVQSTVNDVPQDILPKHIRRIAETIRAALRDKYPNDEPVPGYEWAEKLQFRSAPKISRSGEVIRLKIASLESEKDRIRRTLEREIGKLDEQIIKLQGKISAHERPGPLVEPLG